MRKDTEGRRDERETCYGCRQLHTEKAGKETWWYCGKDDRQMGYDAGDGDIVHPKKYARCHKDV
ncbi:MAG: hypothetical protein GY718_10085 [Lentisphaerae bacterium]|nr:hypothetical protein [Lentisphaerota bacterium]